MVYSEYLPLQQLPNAINSLPNDKFLDLFKLKAFADDKINVNEDLKFVSGRIENVGQGENAGYQHGNQHFLLCPQCFQNASFSRSLKVWILWKRIKAFRKRNSK